MSKSASVIYFVIAGIATIVAHTAVKAAQNLENGKFTASISTLQQTSQDSTPQTLPHALPQAWWEGRIADGWRVNVQVSAGAVLTLNGIAEPEKHNLEITLAINSIPRRGFPYLVRGVQWESLRSDCDDDLLGFLLPVPTVPSKQWRQAEGMLSFDRHPTRSRLRIAHDLPDVLRNVRGFLEVDVASRIRAFDVPLAVTPQWQPIPDAQGWTFWVEIGSPSGAQSAPFRPSEAKAKPPILRVRVRAPRSREPGMSFAPLVQAGLYATEGGRVDAGDMSAEKLEDASVTRDFVVSIADRDLSKHAFRLEFAESVDHIKIPFFYDSIPLLGDVPRIAPARAITGSGSQTVTLPNLRPVETDNIVFQPQSSRIMATLQSSPGGMTLSRRITVESEIRLPENLFNLPRAPRLEITALTDERGDDLAPYLSTTETWGVTDVTSEMSDGWIGPSLNSPQTSWPLRFHIGARAPMPRKFTRLAGFVEVTTYADEVVVPVDAARFSDLTSIETAPGLRVRCTIQGESVLVEYSRPYTVPMRNGLIGRTPARAGPPFVVAVETQMPGEAPKRILPAETARNDDVGGSAKVANAQAVGGHLRLIVIPKVIVRRVEFDYSDVPIAGSWR